MPGFDTFNPSEKALGFIRTSQLQYECANNNEPSTPFLESVGHNTTSPRWVIEMKLIFIAGSWGSGTTAVVGALDSLGVPTLGPHFLSSDPRTHNTFELIPFRELIHQYVDGSTIKHKNNYHSEFVQALEKFKTQLENTVLPSQPDTKLELIALKMPLASICLPEICSTFKTKIIVVHRSFEEIEACRLRRNWKPRFGSLGARHIYSKIFSDLFRCKLSFLGVSYGDFVSNTNQSLGTIIEYCDIEYLRNNMRAAEAFVNAR